MRPNQKVKVPAIYMALTPLLIDRNVEWYCLAAPSFYHGMMLSDLGGCETCCCLTHTYQCYGVSSLYGLDDVIGPARKNGGELLGQASAFGMEQARHGLVF